MGTPLTIKNRPKPETEHQKSLASRLATVQQLEASDLICVLAAKYSSQVLDNEKT